MILSTHGILAAGSDTALLLDSYPSFFAVSLRKLRTAYAGSCVRVRRSSDNAEQDIGFVNNEIDSAGLLTFVGAGDGFITTWYDQVGSNNPVEATTSLQPQIVSSGSLITENGKAALTFTADYLTIAASTALFNFLHNGSKSAISGVCSPTSGANRGIMGNTAADSNKIGFDSTFFTASDSISARVVTGAGAANRAITTDNAGLTGGAQNTFLFSIDADNGTAAERLHAYINGDAVQKLNANTAAPSASNAAHSLQLGAVGSNIFPFTGKFQELIIWDSDQDANVTEIKSNINSYYSIY